MIVGNIVTKIKTNKLDYFNYFDSYEQVNNSLPTLVVGWELAKLLPNYDIFNKKMSENLFWTFSKFEKRSIFDIDMYEFTEYCYDFIIRDVTYFFIDNLLLSNSQLLKIVRKLLSNNNLITCCFDDMVYILCDKIIFGLNKNFISYRQFDFDNIIKKIKEKSYVFLVDEQILIKYRHHIDWLNDKIRFIPYIISKENEEKNIVSIVY